MMVLQVNVHVYMYMYIQYMHVQIWYMYLMNKKISKIIYLVNYISGRPHSIKDRDLKDEVEKHSI